MGRETEAGDLRHAGRPGAEVKAERRRQKPRWNGAEEFKAKGFQVLFDVIPLRECDALATELSNIFENQQTSVKNKIGGVRNLLRTSPRVAEIASSEKLTGILEQMVGRAVFPVRAIFFDKTAEANWRVPWHQDLTIAVVERVETAGFNAWSMKDGIVHVQPPRKILDAMATIRLHLDDCDADKGALKVIPGSHLHGKLGRTEIAGLTQTKTAVVCEIPRGGALLTRPLLLHSSSPARSPSHRRVLHIEYAANELPNGLNWFDRR